MRKLMRLLSQDEKKRLADLYMFDIKRWEYFKNIELNYKHFEEHGTDIDGFVVSHDGLPPAYSAVISFLKEEGISLEGFDKASLIMELRGRARIELGI